MTKHIKEQIEELKSYTKVSIGRGRELMLSVCIFEDGSVVKPMSWGARKSGRFPECPEGSRKVGTFHTHPHMPWIPSFSDKKHTILSPIEYSCIGASVKGEVEIACFIVRDIPLVRELRSRYERIRAKEDALYEEGRRMKPKLKPYIGKPLSDVPPEIAYWYVTWHRRRRRLSAQKAAVTRKINKHFYRMVDRVVYV